LRRKPIRTLHASLLPCAATALFFLGALALDLTVLVDALQRRWQHIQGKTVTPPLHEQDAPNDALAFRR
jgi:hypothetical protein